MTTRPPTLSMDGMVSSGHPAVSTAGLRVLADGGNAIDATLAMAAMTWVTLPGQCGIGGDAFAVVREPDGSVWTVGGGGFGPDGGDLDFYSSLGLRSLPLDGVLAVAVPGAMSALAALHEARATRPLTDLWEPAARRASNGVPCSVLTRDDVRETHSSIVKDPGLSAVYLPGGAVPRVGQRLLQPDLAQSIRSLALDPSDFYTGSFASRAVEFMQRRGAPFSGDEWSAGLDARMENSIRGTYAGATVHQTGLPTPGWMVLQQAALCDRSVVSQSWMTSPAIDRMATAARMSFEDRLALCASDNDEWTAILAPSNIRTERTALDNRTRGGAFAVDGGDTTSTVAVDGDGRAVSFIHSLAFTFGAKVTIPGTGVVLNNRFGRGAYLVPGHPNCAAPRRKPLHTLNAWIATDSAGELLHAGNTPGGDGQVQWNMQLLSHLLDHGLDPADAVSAPRFTVFPGSDSNVIDQPAELRVESRVANSTLLELTSLGHDVVVQGPWSGGGSAQVISYDKERGLLSGAADPREEGIALGL